MTRNRLLRPNLWQLLVFFLCFGMAPVGWSHTDTSPGDPAQTQTQTQNQTQIETETQTQTHTEAQNAPGSDVDQAPKITIGAGDQLDVEVFDTPELSGTTRVSQTGEVNLSVLGNIHVAGLTPNQAARKIEVAFKSNGLLIDPHVTVSIGEYASQGATITGEVHSPGVYPTLGSRKLLEMIALAGGVTLTAGRTATIIHHDDPQHPHDILLVPNNKSLGAQENPVIVPGDTVVISRAGIIYILGDVGKAGGYLIDNNERLSLIQALTLAGGWTRTSAQSKVILIRQVPEGREEIKLDLNHVVHGGQLDIKVSNGDIVFVPSSLGKVIAYQGISAAVNGAQQAVIYGALYSH